MKAKDIFKRDPSIIEVPFRDLDTKESITLGFRQSMFDIEKDGTVYGGVTTGSGLGTDYILMEWGERQVVVRGRDLLKAWVSTFSKEQAESLPE